MTFLELLFFIQNCNLVSLRCDLSGRSLGLPFINAYETEGYLLNRFVTVEERHLRPSIRKSGAGDPHCPNKGMTFCVDLSLCPITDQQKVIRSTEIMYSTIPYLNDSGVVLIFRKTKKKANLTQTFLFVKQSLQM